MRFWMGAVILLTSLQFACGGSSGSRPPLPTPSTSPPVTTPTSGDPCSTSGIEADQPTSESLEAGAPSDVPSAKSRPKLDGDPRWSVLNSLWLHAAIEQRRLRTALATETHAQDVGDVVVLQDAGDIITASNPFDLKSVHLRFSKNGSGGYDVAHIDSGFHTPLGSRLTLTDDDTSGFTLAFTLPFFNSSQTRAFVNSDGNITFGESDVASTDRSVSRFLTGAPRVAPFFADLDPSSANSRVYLQSGASGAVITWCTVRGFESTSTVTTQAVLLPDGTIEFHYGAGIGLRDAVVGLSPGHTGQFQTVDLAANGPTGGGGNAVGERFSAAADIDLVALARRFYQSHGDNFDQIIAFTSTSVVSGNTFAYESTIANEIGGIGVDIYDTSKDFGSGGRLRSMVVMDTLSKYPSDPGQKFLGENSTVSVLGQESGHRWLAFLRFQNVNGQSSTVLLGRDQAHWSFFMDSAASVMEGNDIEDLGGGSFKTVDAVRRYSLLDQYAMGLIAPNDVPDFFYVESPTNVVPPRVAADAPQIGVTFNGTRRDVSIQDVIDVMGQRNPSSSNSPRVHRQAFVYIVAAGTAVDAAQVAKVERIRAAWVNFFAQATNKRMRADTSLK